MIIWFPASSDQPAIKLLIRKSNFEFVYCTFITRNYEPQITVVWFTALDLQHCGITMVGAEALLNLVKDNEFLSVVDIRGNSQVPKSFVGAVVQQLADNNRESTPEVGSIF